MPSRSPERPFWAKMDPTDVLPTPTQPLSSHGEVILGGGRAIMLGGGTASGPSSPARLTKASPRRLWAAPGCPKGQAAQKPAGKKMTLWGLNRVPRDEESKLLPLDHKRGTGGVGGGAPDEHIA